MCDKVALVLDQLTRLPDSDTWIADKLATQAIDVQ